MISSIMRFCHFKIHYTLWNLIVTLRILLHIKHLATFSNSVKKYVFSHEGLKTIGVEDLGTLVSKLSSIVYTPLTDHLDDLLPLSAALWCELRGTAYPIPVFAIADDRWSKEILAFSFQLFSLKYQTYYIHQKYLH